MELISTHFVKTQDVGYHGNLFGGVMLAWLDEAAAAFAAQVADSPRMVTKHIAGLTFEKTSEARTNNQDLRRSRKGWKNLFNVKHGS